MIVRARVLPGFCVLSACLALSGCSPEVTGAIGIGVDASGQPVGYVQSCRGVIDGTRVDSEPLRDSEPAIGRWEARPAVLDFSSWSFTEPTAGWQTTKELQKLRPHVVYRLMGGDNEGTGTTGSVLFTMADLQAMTSGEVRVYDDAKARAAPQAEESTQSPAQEARDENAFMKVVSVAEFRAHACAQVQ